MCALKTHIKLSVFGNIFSKIKKAVITFSILEKMFPKTENLMCKIQKNNIKASSNKIVEIPVKSVLMQRITGCSNF